MSKKEEKKMKAELYFYTIRRDNRLAGSFRILLVVCGFLLASCSSVPKRPAEVFVLQTMTETQLQLANAEADRGNYAEALSMLGEAWRMAVSTDRPALRVRVNISRGNVLFYLGRRQEAEDLWQTAQKEAEAANDRVLAAACRIYRQRSTLSADSSGAEGVLAAVQAELGNVKSDKLFTALAWTVIGLAEKELGRFENAEKSIRNALSIHEGGRYLEQAGYDWYLIASVRSVAKNYQGALDALDAALGFDRRSENTFALGMDWAARGDVFRKMGREEDAVAAWRRAAEIFRSLLLEEQALAVESRIETP
jgi:tetratricopeptide (TPR) repeat protein